jgi:uracil-DNA glycosylase family 4
MEKYYTFYDGNLDARLMIVGQSPVYPLHPGKPFGLRETKHQHVGSRWLKKCFRDADLDYMDTYVTNLVKDSPENNKATPEMVRNCKRFLEKEISMFGGSLILALGTTACGFFGIKNGEVSNTRKKRFMDRITRRT